MSNRSYASRNNGATIEEINDELIIKGLELGFLDLLAKEFPDITPLAGEMFDYDDATSKYHIRKNTKFRAQIPLEVKVKYFVVSYLRRAQIEHRDPTFDDIVLYVMPLLKNGVTPEKATIVAALEEVAERVGKDRWRLQKVSQFTLF